jgi:ketosteroid isomerase-like protein
MDVAINNHSHSQLSIVATPRGMRKRYSSGTSLASRAGETSVGVAMNKQIDRLVEEFIDTLHEVEGAQTDPEATDALDNMTALFSPDAKMTNSHLSKAGRDIQGDEAIRAFWAEYRIALAPGHSHFHQVTTGERAAGLFWTTEGTGPEGQRIKYDGATLLEYNDQGHIIAFRGYYDTQELEEQEAATN